MRVLAYTVLMSVGLAACTFGDTRQLVLDGPPSVRTDALGPVDGPTAVLSDGSEPEGLVWSLSPDGVATVEAGRVTAVAAGEATITGDWNGQQVSWTLVVDPAVSLSLVAPPSTVPVGQTAQLRVTAKVGDQVVESGAVSWTSSSPEVLAVTESGEIEARKVGISYIVVKRGASEAMAEIQVVETE